VTEPSDREPTNRDILYAIDRLNERIDRVNERIDALRFDMIQHFGAVENLIAAVNTRVATLEDRFEWMSVTVRAKRDHMNPGGDSSAA
jgi:hypothetical protein